MGVRLRGLYRQPIFGDSCRHSFRGLWHGGRDDRSPPRSWFDPGRFPHSPNGCTAGRGGGGGGSLVFCGMTIKAPTMNLMGISVGLWTNEISLPFTLMKSPSSRIGSAERHLNCVVSPFCESRNSAVTVPSSPPLSTETTIRRVYSSGVLRPKTLFLSRPATFAAVMSSCIGPRVRRVGLPSEAASGSRGLSVHPCCGHGGPRSSRTLGCRARWRRSKLHRPQTGHIALGLT